MHTARCGVLLLCIATQTSARSSYVVLKHPGYVPGFFSVFNTVVGWCAELEKLKRAGELAGYELDFGKIGLYYDKKHGKNWWNYYFEPISAGSALGGKKIELSDDQCNGMSVYAEAHMPRKQAHAIICKYIHVRQNIAAKINEFYQRNMAGYCVIGVHYRGTDKQSESPRVRYDTMLAHIQNAIATYYDPNKQPLKIFVATDEIAFINFMRKCFPGTIICINAVRSSGIRPVHAPNKASPYKKGEDAILDCVLLSKCCAMVRVASNLSSCAEQFNPTMPVIFVKES